MTKKGASQALQGVHHHHQGGPGVHKKPNSCHTNQHPQDEEKEYGKARRKP